MGIRDADEAQQSPEKRLIPPGERAGKAFWRRGLQGLVSTATSLSSFQRGQVWLMDKAPRTPVTPSLSPPII